MMNSMEAEYHQLKKVDMIIKFSNLNKLNMLST